MACCHRLHSEPYANRVRSAHATGAGARTRRERKRPLAQGASGTHARRQEMSEDRGCSLFNGAAAVLEGGSARTAHDGWILGVSTNRRRCSAVAVVSGHSSTRCACHCTEVSRASRACRSLLNAPALSLTGDRIRDRRGSPRGPKNVLLQSFQALPICCS